MAVGVAAGATSGAATAAPEEEQTEFDIMLTEIGANKIQVIKAVRERRASGSRRPRISSIARPRPSSRGLEEEADAARAKLEEAGATAQIQ